MLSGGPLDVEGQAACRMAYATFLRHGGEAHDATLLYHYQTPGGHHEDAPGSRGPGVVVDPRLGDVLHKLI